MITDNKLRRLFELKKSIRVITRRLTEDGLFIGYQLNDEIKNIHIESVSIICELLKQAGLIQDCFYAEFYHHLTWETETNTERNGEHYQECKTCYGSFKDFVEQTRFSLNDANEVVAFYILNNQKIPA